MPLSDYVYWIDANLPPQAAEWLKNGFEVNARHVFYMDMLSASDEKIFLEAQKANENIIIITKDEDFVELVLRKNSPPKVIWITTGNLSNIHLKKILLDYLEQAVEKLDNPACSFVEIS